MFHLRWYSIHFNIHFFRNHIVYLYIYIYVYIYIYIFKSIYMCIYMYSKKKHQKKIHRKNQPSTASRFLKYMCIYNILCRICVGAIYYIYMFICLSIHPSIHLPTYLYLRSNHTFTTISPPSINQTQQRLAVAHASGGAQLAISVGLRHDATVAAGQPWSAIHFLGGPEALSKDQKRIEHLRVKNHHDDQGNFVAWVAKCRPV